MALTGGTHTLQERYADQIVKPLRKSNNLRKTAGRKYEGNPKAGAIKIPVRDTEVTVGDYNINTGGTLSTSATTYLTVTITEDKFINELCDGYEAVAVPDNVKAQRIDSAGFSLEKDLEADFIKELKDNGTESSDVAALTSATAYNSIVTEIGELTKLGIDKRTITVGITTDVETLLLTDQRYTNTASQVGSERAMDGVVNMIRGCEVRLSDNLGLINTTNNVEFVVYSDEYAQVGEEFRVNPDFVDLKDGKHIGSSALQGRMITWEKLTKATACRIKRDSAA